MFCIYYVKFVLIFCLKSFRVTNIQLLRKSGRGANTFLRHCTDVGIPNSGAKGRKSMRKGENIMAGLLFWFLAHALTFGSVSPWLWTQCRHVPAPRRWENLPLRPAHHYHLMTHLQDQPQFPTSNTYHILRTQYFLFLEFNFYVYCRLLLVVIASCYLKLLCGSGARYLECKKYTLKIFFFFYGFRFV